MKKLFEGNGYDGYIDPFKFLKGYSFDPLMPIGGTYELPKTMQLVILGKEQYLVDKDGKGWHIYNAATLNNLYAAGIISTLIPDLVSSVEDTGKEFVVLTQE